MVSRAGGQAVKAEVVVVTYEALSSDQSVLSQITWELVVLDERNRKRAGKQAAALSALAESLSSSRLRLLISQGRPLEVPRPVSRLSSLPIFGVVE